MLIFLLSNAVLAEQTVILEDKSHLQAFQTEVEPNAQILLWQDIQSYPLIFTGIASPERCTGIRTNVSQLQESLTKAEDALNYLEIDKAINYIKRIQNDIVCLDERIPSQLIGSTYFLLGVAHSYNNDDDLARQSWNQALLYTPNLEWDTNIEPSNQPKFEETKQELHSQTTSRMMLVPQQAKLSIDGSPIIQAGDVFSGVHLVQHDAVNFEGYRINTDASTDTVIVSFADFPSRLTETMAPETSRQELLVGLRILNPEADFKVIEQDQLWYLAPGSSTWNVQQVQSAPKSKNSTSSTTAFDQRKMPLVLAGTGSIFLGGVAFFIANSTQAQFQNYTEQSQEAQTTYTTNRISWASGVGLTTVGSALILSGLF